MADWMSEMNEGEALLRAGFRPAIGKDGRPGIERDGLFIPVSDERPDAVVCWPVDRGDTRVAGSVRRPCATCGTACWVAPSSQAVLARHIGVPVVCVDCVMPEKDEGAAPEA